MSKCVEDVIFACLHKYIIILHVRGCYMKEYCIYIRNGGGMPYILNTFKDLNTAKIKLYEMISLEIERNRPYFVDNDFYDNKYNICRV